MRSRQVALWSQLSHCECYIGTCTIHRRADVQIRQQQIFELQMEVDMYQEEMRKDLEKIARLEAMLQAERKKAVEDV